MRAHLLCGTGLNFYVNRSDFLSGHIYKLPKQRKVRNPRYLVIETEL